MKKMNNGNLVANPNIEYIYDLDMVWFKHEEIIVDRGIIVTNVKLLDSGGYSFNIKGSDKEYECYYGWAFIENTERNIELLKEIKQENIFLQQKQLKIRELRNNLDRLFEKDNLKSIEIDEIE
ncbi:hypothetical protein M0Q97_01420 [Candidatus Dojkabacteria bacterium]|jgi:hypothetical protein|nr:hypothetical protein [Candidatus Dojkabacteria bacterium]